MLDVIFCGILYVLLLFLTIHERLTLLNANCIDFSVQAVNINEHLNVFKSKTTNFNHFKRIML